MLTLQETSLDWALAHTLSYGDTDVCPLPFEYQAIQFDWNNIRQYLRSKDLLNWEVRPHRNLLSPKAKYGFRVITQLDPLDFLLFASAVKEIAADIESRRIPTNMNTVFSYRTSIANDGQLFDPNIGYHNFITITQEILEGHPEFNYVAITDIADFYSRIYIHRLENALTGTRADPNHIKAIVHLLSGWNGTETFGIPVGNAPSRLLAEITISDVDEALLAHSIRFIRYNDDYRIFTNNYTDAYRALVFLADVLFRNHGLHLQPQKTDILTVPIFKERYLPTPEKRELQSLQTIFNDLVAELGLRNPYAQIEFEDLSPEQQQVINSLNLIQLFTEQVNRDEIDLSMTKFLLRRMGQLGDLALVDLIFANINKLYPVFPDIISYLRNLRNLAPEQREEIGKNVLDLLEDSIISELEYHRLWALHLFTDTLEWDNQQRFFNMLARSTDDVSKRKLILAMGRASQRFWFQSQWRNPFDLSSWPRRALFAGSSCLAPDARRHWVRSIEARLDPLELSVIRWTAQHPFG